MTIDEMKEALKTKKLYTQSGSEIRKAIIDALDELMELRVKDARPDDC